MRHRCAFRKLGRSPDHRRALLRNLVTQVVKYGRIRTTLAKAKELKRVAEKTVTLAMSGKVNARKSASKMIFERPVLEKLFREMPTRFADRPGGYTRIVRLGRRRGDNAEMCYIGFVDRLPSRHEIERRALERRSAPVEGKEQANEDIYLLSAPSS